MTAREVATGVDHHHERGADGQRSQRRGVGSLHGHADREDEEEGPDQFDEKFADLHCMHLEGILETVETRCLGIVGPSERSDNVVGWWSAVTARRTIVHAGCYPNLTSMCVRVIDCPNDSLRPSRTGAGFARARFAVQEGSSSKSLL